VPGRRQHQADRGGQRTAQRLHQVRRDPGEQRPRLFGLPTAGQHRRGLQRTQPEPGERHRMPWEMQHRPEHVLGERVEAGGERLEQPAPPLAIRSETLHCGR
jgi:hypothetical protein